MKKINVIIFAILTLAFSYSCKNEKITNDEKSKSNFAKISVVKLNDKLLIKKETNGKIEFLENLSSENYTVIPIVDNKNLLGLRASPKNLINNKNATLSSNDFRIYGSRYIGDGLAMETCKHLETLDFFFFEFNGDLHIQAPFGNYNLANIGVLTVENITGKNAEYLSCWRDNDPMDTVE